MDGWTMSCSLAVSIKVVQEFVPSKQVLFSLAVLCQGLRSWHDL